MDNLGELRALLLGKEQDSIRRLLEHIDNPAIRAHDVAESLPEALHKKQHNQKLIKSLEHPITVALNNSIHKNASQFAEAFYPAMLPSIKRSIIEILRNMMQSINQIIDQSFSLKGLSWRFESMRTGVPFHEIVLRHTMIYRVEQVFLIHRDSGLLIQHVTDSDYLTKDPDAVSAMLTAIQDFAKDAMNEVPDDPESGTISTINMDDKTIWLNQGEHAILATIIAGTPPLEINAEFQNTLANLHHDFAEQLADFKGDQEDLAGTDSYLEHCLLKELDTKKSSNFSFYIFGVLFLGLFAYLGWSWYQASEKQARIHALTEKLNMHPGVVIFKQEENDDLLHFYGLLDPLASGVDLLLNDSGFDPEKIKFHWGSYVSLDQDFVLKRATMALAPPQSVDLKFQNGMILALGTASDRWRTKCENLAGSISGVKGCDTGQLIDRDQLLYKEVENTLKPPDSIRLTVEDEKLKITGRAPTRWIEQVEKNIAQIEGLKAIETSEVINSDMEEFQDLFVKLAKSQLYFDTNSVQINENDNAFAYFNSTLQRLRYLAKQLGSTFSIELTGRSIGNPSTPANQELSLKRAQSVADYLKKNHSFDEQFIIINNSKTIRPEDLHLNLRRVDIELLIAP